MRELCWAELVKEQDADLLCVSHLERYHSNYFYTTFTNHSVLFAVFCACLVRFTNDIT